MGSKRPMKSFKIPKTCIYKNLKKKHILSKPPAHSADPFLYASSLPLALYAHAWIVVVFT